jgi:hypothetical protein
MGPNKRVMVYNDCTCEFMNNYIKKILNFIIHSPHMLVWVISERFLPTGGTFRAILASESHWLQPMLVLSIHWWPATASMGNVLDVEIVKYQFV